MLCDQESLDTQLKSLLTSNKIMLFMKGSPDAPKCGFSRTAVGILREENVEFGSFDILEDDQVRQGLKKFSNWPTYPQVRISERKGLEAVLMNSSETEAKVPGCSAFDTIVASAALVRAETYYSLFLSSRTPLCRTHGLTPSDPLICWPNCFVPSHGHSMM